MSLRERLFGKQKPETPAASEVKTLTPWEEIVAASHKNRIGTRQNIRDIVMTLNGKSNATGLNYFLSRVEEAAGYGDEVKSLLPDVPLSVRSGTDPDYSIYQVRLDDRNNRRPDGITKLVSVLLFCQKPHKDHKDGEIFFVLSTDVNGKARWEEVRKQYANS